MIDGDSFQLLKKLFMSSTSNHINFFQEQIPPSIRITVFHSAVLVCTDCLQVWELFFQWNII